MDIFQKSHYLGDMAKTYEVNFDGLVGPIHNYSGLSFGNKASTHHQSQDSSPLQAVLQGLDKMKALADLGLKQGLLPPQERPDLGTLRRLGFTGSDKKILEEVSKKAPSLLLAVTSASSMWTANAATVSTSADTRDHRVHFTPANLVSKFHRSLEPEATATALKKIFKNPKYFTHHDPLRGGSSLGDEGAANHTRLCSQYGKKGIEFFVYGRHGIRSQEPEPKKFPARQTYEASEAIARTHGLDSNAVIFAQQNPEAIDAGVFHNDVAGVGNQSVYFYHQQAYLNSSSVTQELGTKFQNVCGSPLRLIEVSASEISLADAVQSYLFNSQLITLTENKMLLIAPIECQEMPAVARYLERLTKDLSQPIREVRHFDLRQSMRNGGGPACLRLRVVLTEKELKAVHPKVLMNDQLYKKLTQWAKKYYRDRLSADDLRDPSLIRESRTALDTLTQILGLGSLYPFQRK